MTQIVSNGIYDLLGEFPDTNETPDGPDAPAAPDDRLVTAAELADWIGVAPQTVNRNARQGILNREGPSACFWLKRSVGDYCAHLRDSSQGRLLANPTLAVEKLRVARETADKLALANAAARGELVKAADVERAWSGILRDVRAALLAVPSRVGSQSPHLTANDISVITSEIRRALERLADGS